MRPAAREAPAGAFARAGSMRRLEARALTKSYGRRVVVKEVNVWIDEGEVVGLAAASVAIAAACVVLAQALDRRHRRRLEVEP